MLFQIDTKTNTFNTFLLKKILVTYLLGLTIDTAKIYNLKRRHKIPKCITIRRT